MEISDLQSAVMLLNRYYNIQKFGELSNQILFSLVAQWAAKLREVKLEGSKKVALHMRGETLLFSKSALPHMRKAFFRTSQLNILQFCSLSSFTPTQYFI